MQLATLLYVRTDTHTLMLLRNKKRHDLHAGRWNGLGGKFEPGEMPEECARRELLEESGLHAEELEWRGLLTFPLFDGIKDWYVHVFVIPRFTGELIDSPEGELAWIENDALLDLNLWPGDRHFLPWVFGDRFFSARFNYLDGEVESYHRVFYGSLDKENA
ncbi:MAG: 8-oxo-dGTP diphosphatase [Candidatus Delongbacteria bacterium]|nr:8-oxo-dGTP diphosphatase [Candidatus Delongbacteria bacterium]